MVVISISSGCCFVLFFDHYLAGSTVMLRLQLEFITTWCRQLGGWGGQGRQWDMGWESCKHWIMQHISTHFYACLPACWWPGNAGLRSIFFLVAPVVGIEQYGLPPGEETTPTSSAWKGERSRWMQTMLGGGQQSAWWKGSESTWHRTWARPTILAVRLASEQEGSGPKKGVYQDCKEQSSQGRNQRV